MIRDPECPSADRFRLSDKIPATSEAYVLMPQVSQHVYKLLQNHTTLLQSLRGTAKPNCGVVRSPKVLENLPPLLSALCSSRYMKICKICSTVVVFAEARSLNS